VVLPHRSARNNANERRRNAIAKTGPENLYRVINKGIGMVKNRKKGGRIGTFFGKLFGKIGKEMRR